MRPISYATHVVMKATAATGAAVASTRNESFSREIFWLSVNGRTVFPTRRQLA